MTKPTYDIVIPIYFGNLDELFNVLYYGVILIRLKPRSKPLHQVVSLGSFLPKLVQGHNGPIEIDPGYSGPIEATICDRLNFVFNKMINSVLFLLFDLDVIRKPKVTTPLVQVSRSNGRRNPNVWPIHSRGYEETSFGRLRHMHCIQQQRVLYFSQTGRECAL